MLGASLPPGAIAVAREVGGDPPALEPEEEGAVARAVPSRRAEFAAGRACAREALRRLGLSGRLPIPVGPERAPRWPDGYVGSITHAGGIAAAAAAPPGLVRGLGIDIEPVAPLSEEIERLVLTPEELAEREGPPSLVRFAAKEAVHKAIHPATGAWLDFLDVTLRFGAESGTFRACPSSSATRRVAGLEELVGAWRLVDGFVLAGVWLPAV